MPKQIFKQLLAGMLWLTLPAHLACQGNGRTTKLMENSRSEDVPMTFYGKVIDDHGQPVEEAEVELHIDRFSLAGVLFEATFPMQFKTDKDGCFSIRGESGRRLSIAKIEKKKYDNKLVFETPDLFHFYKRNNVVLSYYSNRVRNVPYVPDPKTPMVYRLRKKGEQTFVLKNGASFTFQPAGPIQAGWDIVANHRIRENDLEDWKSYRPYTCDLKIKATFDPKTKIWTVVLTLDDPKNGVIASDQLLYEAPADGYQPSYTFLVDPSKTYRSEDSDYAVFVGKYLYVKSRGYTSLYSRVRIGEIIKGGDEGELRVGLSAVLNPYGDRNLEEATDLPGDVRLKIWDEVDEAYRRGTRPTNPDLAQRVQEWEKSRPLADKVKDWLKK